MIDKLNEYLEHFTHVVIKQTQEFRSVLAALESMRLFIEQNYFNPL